MGSKSSKENQNKKKETKIHSDTISTVTMALDSNGKPKSRLSTAEIYAMNKYPSQLNSSSSVRFNPNYGGMDLNGNHFYPNSLGKGSVNSRSMQSGNNNNNNNQLVWYIIIQLTLIKSQAHLLKLTLLRLIDTQL